MESLRELSELEIKRASLLSVERISAGVGKISTKLIAPKDKLILVHFIFFFFGLGGGLSMPFFITANDYWMYKFRDISQETYNSSNKTVLQSYFASATSITQSVPGVITTMVAALYGHKINIRPRILGTLFGLFITYVLFTIFIKIDTDSWQMEFFILTLFFYVIVTAITIIFQMANLNLISRFPPQYMKTQMYGQGAAGIFSALLQVVCLSLTDSSTSSALIYFVCGSLVLLITAILGYISKYSALFRFHLGDTIADTARPVHTLREMKEVMKKIWPCLFIFFTTIASGGCGHPNITSLVVSENYDQGYAWNDKYFVPVVTFLSPEIYGLLGRYLGRPIITQKTAIWVVAIYTVRLIIFGPIYMFCNAKPRSHLPVWFPHDWEYMLIIAMVFSTGSFFFTCVFLSMPVLAGNKQNWVFC